MIPCRASEPRNSSCITSTSWSTRIGGQLDGRVGDRVLDDPVGEAVACAVERVALEPLLDVGPQRVEVGEVAERPDEVLVEVGQDLLAELA